MFNAVYSGKLHSRYSSWKLILIKELDANAIIQFIGKWKTNSHWGETDFRGNARYIAPSGYRGPGHPEGCVLIRLKDGQIFSFNALPIEIDKNYEGDIYIACNDAESDLALRDNNGVISYTITYTRT
jgi:hypothetical protein